MIFDIPNAAVAWLRTGERGTSSQTIFEVMTGLPLTDGVFRRAVPFDPADFRRCRLLLEAVPEWRHRLGEMAAVGPRWSALIPRWDELCATMDAEAPEWRDGVGDAPLTYRLIRATERAA